MNQQCLWLNGGSKNLRYIECSASKQCWIKSRKKVYQSHNKYADESNALLVGGLFTQKFDNFCSRSRRKNMFERKMQRKKGETGTEERTSTHWIATKTAQILKQSLPTSKWTIDSKSSLWIDCLWLFLFQRVLQSFQQKLSRIFLNNGVYTIVCHLYIILCQTIEQN